MGNSNSNYAAVIDNGLYNLHVRDIVMPFNVDDDDFDMESFVEHSVTCSTHWVDGAPHKQAIFCTECSEPDLRTGVQAVDVWSCEVLK